MSQYDKQESEKGGVGKRRSKGWPAAPETASIRKTGREIRKKRVFGSLCQPEPQSSALTLCLFTLTVIFKVF